MAGWVRWSVAVIVLSSMGAILAGQENPAKPAPEPMPPAANIVAATVNGQAIPELAVFRAFSQRPKVKDYDLARKEILNYLIDNVLIDQYLLQLKINIDAKEIDDKFKQMKADASAKDPEGFAKTLKQLFLTEEDLRKEMVCALRWDRFVEQQATEKTLKAMFEGNTSMFDGSQMQARHILVKLDSAEQMTAKINQLKKQIEVEVAQEFAQLAEEFKTEKEKARVLERVFARTAAKESTCPTKENGGDLGGWFMRAGDMVEPFARAAFALKLYQMSEPVLSEFGCHLILATDQKPGKEVKFEMVKNFVLEVYSGRLREAVIAAMRPNAKIVIHAPMK